jgi:hypothetical protein
MSEIPPPPRPAPMRREDKQLVWLILIAAWLALAAWGVYLFLPHFIHATPPPLTPVPTGLYVTVQEYTDSLEFRTESGQVYAPAGVTLETLDAAARARAGARMRELAPVGATVYVEPLLAGGLSGKGAANVSVWLPPAEAADDAPFPYAASRLVAALLVQEGLVPADESGRYLYQNELLFLQDDARNHGLGLWAPR